MIRPDLMTAILDRPAEDAPRLAAADALDEDSGSVPCPRCHGTGDLYPDGAPTHDRNPDCPTCRGSCSAPDGLADRADYIRRAVAVERLGVPDGPCPPNCPCGGEGDRLADIVAANGDRWNPPQPWERPGRVGYTWRRGFIQTAQLTLADWQHHAPALLAAHPLERVEVADVPGLVFDIWPSELLTGKWAIRGMLTLPPTGGPPSSPALGWNDRHQRDEWFPTRPALVAGASAAVAEITARLRAAAGDRWPGRGDGTAGLPWQIVFERTDHRYALASARLTVVGVVDPGEARAGDEFGPLTATDSGGRAWRVPRAVLIRQQWEERRARWSLEATATTAPVPADR